MLPGYKPCLFLSSVQGLVGIARVYNGRLLQKGSSGWMNLISVAPSSHIPLGGVYKQALLSIRLARLRVNPVTMFQFLLFAVYASLTFAKTVNYDFSIGWVTVSSVNM
jgi:hypothetical protein